MNNMKREVSRHNNKLLNGNNNNINNNNDNNGAAAQTFKCTCAPLKKPETCRVLPGIGCQVATVTRTDTSQRETYTGSTYNFMKIRFNQHNSDINTLNDKKESG